MAEWLFEDGIGEARAALVEAGRIVAAEIDLAEGLKVGLVARGRLIDAARGGGLVLIGTEEAALDRVPAGVSVGREVTVEIVREAIPEPGRAKRAKAVASDREPTAAPTLRERVVATGLPVRALRAHEADALEQAGWSELIEEAQSGEIAFAGGTLRMTPTPAMTLFDVDGSGDAAALAFAAAHAVAEAIARHRIGGSVGVDFPTLAGKAERARIGEAIDAALAKPFASPFERTAMNGFGFLQIVRPRPRASIPEIVRADPVGAEARAALRALERVAPTTANHHRLPAAVLERIESRADWLAELVRRMGRTPILAP